MHCKNVGKSLPLCHHALLPLSPLHSYGELCTVKNGGKSLPICSPCSSSLFHLCTLMVNYIYCELCTVKNVGKSLPIWHHALPPLPPLQSYGELRTVKNGGKSLPICSPCSSSSSTSALLWWIIFIVNYAL